MMNKHLTNVQIKINVSGSWANLVNCGVADYDAVKAACTALAKAHQGRMRFRALDADDDVIEEYGYVQNGEHGFCWREPARRP